MALIGAPLVDGPGRVDCKRSDGNGMQSLVARHYGYVHRFGIWHEREITLSANKFILTGGPAGFSGQATARSYMAATIMSQCVSTCLSIELYRNAQDRMVLAAPSSNRWLFTCNECAASVEESIFFANLEGPRQSRQFALAFQASQLPQVQWQFTRSPA